MKKDYYMHQKFLLDCDYEEVSLPDSSFLKNEFIQDFTESINLFDTDKEITRKVKLSYLLKEIDTRNDLSEFLNKTNFTDNLIIENDMKDQPESLAKIGAEITSNIEPYLIKWIISYEYAQKQYWFFVI